MVSVQRLTVGLGYRYDSAYLRDRVVQVDAFDVEFKPDLAPSGSGQRYVAPASMFESMATDPPYDVGELAFATYVQAVDQGAGAHSPFVRARRVVRASRLVRGAHIGPPCGQQEEAWSY